jgi:periplasmic protein TonB
MYRRFFEDLVESGTRRNKQGKRRLTLPVSIAVHVILLFAVVIVPYLRYSEMPELAEGTVRAFFVEPAAGPPPPPPPPAAAPKKATTEAPKISKPKPVIQETPKFVAPVEVPKEVPQDEGVDAGAIADAAPAAGGVPGGEPGGVEGGVAGGVPGGVVGGTLGGDGGEVKKEEPPPPPPDKPVRVGGQIKAPRKMRDSAPVYPEVAKQARVEGVVVLEATISPEGRVDNVKVLRGSPLLNDAALNAVKSWAYTPTLLNGVPVAVVMTVTVSFKLS